MRAASFIPRGIDSWNGQYYYQTEDPYGNYVPLTGEIIDDVILTRRSWHRTLIDSMCVKKVVLLCDALYLPQFLDSQLITCESGVY